jgi:hypothetical protein
MAGLAAVCGYLFYYGMAAAVGGGFGVGISPPKVLRYTCMPRAFGGAMGPAAFAVITRFPER